MPARTYRIVAATAATAALGDWSEGCKLALRWSVTAMRLVINTPMARWCVTTGPQVCRYPSRCQAMSSHFLLLICGSMRWSAFSGNYHDDAGGKGNFLKGAYTAPDKAVTAGTTSTASGSGRSSITNNSDRTPTRTSASGGTFTSSIARRVSDAAATSGSATTGRATSVSATPASGGKVLKAHAVIGALWLGAALVL